MTDVLTPVQRRKNMQQIRARNTKPEMLIRRGLHALGLRYRLYVKELPGCPDLVFPRYKVAVFINGCFWHAHGCSRSNTDLKKYQDLRFGRGCVNQGLAGSSRSGSTAAAVGGRRSNVARPSPAPGRVPADWHRPGC